jgi:hypothetical protein
MALDIQLIYELSPIPHGTQRQSIAKLLSDWGWQARPLQPGKGSYHHMACRVGAQKPPPQTVMTGFQNDIVITQVKELKQQPPKQQLVASNKTQRHLRAAPPTSTSSRSAQDPWLESSKDPWQNGGKITVAPQGEGKQRLVELHDKLSKDITSKITQDLETHAQAAFQAAAASSGASNDQHEHRLKALEVGMQELQSQNSQFGAWFTQAGDRLKATEANIGAMQQTLNTHQHEIHALGSTFQATMKNVKDDLSSEMNQSFNNQMSRLEALLEKKQRTD